MGIASVLLRLERDAVDKNHDDDWISHLLYTHLLPGAKNLSDNNVSFIVFNYDRLIEVFFALAISTLHGEPIEYGVEQVESIEFIHPYGKLSPGFDRSVDSHATWYEPISYRVREAAKCIKTISPDRADESDEFVTCRSLINKADQIVFLGFGFNPTNCTRLGLGTLEYKSRSRKFVGTTAYGMKQEEIRQTKRYIGCQIMTTDTGEYRTNDCVIGGTTDTCLDFLRDWLRVE